MGAVTKEDLYAFHNCRRIKTVPAMFADGKSIRIQSLMEGERAKIEAKIVRGEMETARAWSIVFSVVDDEGHRVFADADVDFVLALDAAITNELIQAIDDHNELHDNRETKVEEAVKN